MSRPSQAGHGSARTTRALARDEFERYDLHRKSDGSAPDRRELLLRFWRSAHRFWDPTGSWTSWLLSAAVLLTTLAGIAAAYAMNLWNRAVFDALEQRDRSTVLACAALYLPLLAVSVCLVVAQVYARLMLRLRWRAWLNDHLLDRWLARGHHYHLNLRKGLQTLPEYRITEDTRVATEAPIDLVTGVANAVLSAATFIVVLWSIGGALTLTVAGRELTIPGFLVLAAVLYAVIASWSMILIGSGFVVAAEAKSQAEAEYLYALTRLRENGESIAVLGGEGQEYLELQRRMDTVVSRWREICRQTMRTTFVAQTSSYVAWVLPIILCAPKYLDGSMTLGQVMQAASAFTMVQVAFNWLVDNYPRLAEWTASASRVAELLMALDRLETSERSAGHIQQAATTTAALRLRHLTVTTADGTVLIQDLSIEIAGGERVVLAGDSGTGKSTLEQIPPDVDQAQ